MNVETPFEADAHFGKVGEPGASALDDSLTLSPSPHPSPAVAILVGGQFAGARGNGGRVPSIPVKYGIPVNRMITQFRQTLLQHD